MKHTILGASLLVALLAAAADEEGPRNPFWPQDFEGTRHPITLSPRIQPKPKVEAPKPGSPEAKAARQQKAKAEQAARRQADEAAIKAEEAAWAAARKALRFGPSMSFNKPGENRTTVMINGRSYVEGNLISCNVGERRFTWKVESITPDGKLQLKRIKSTPLNTSSPRK